MEKSKSNNLMDLIELIVVTLILITLIWRNVEAEKASPIELIIAIYLGWELFRKFPKFFNKKKL